jgi:hypothetical protein
MRKTKQCTKCHQTYPATKKNFSQHKRTKDGFDSWCRRCHRALSKVWRAANRSHQAALRKKWGAKHPLYKTWASMMERCFNKEQKSYRFYGSLGVSVCEHWQDFSTFERDMSPKPEGTTLGRFGDVGNYSCFRCGGNAVWMTHAEQVAEARKKRAALKLAA